MLKYVRASAAVAALAAGGCAAVKSEKFETQECNFGQSLSDRSACRSFDNEGKQNPAGATEADPKKKVRVVEDKEFPRSMQKGVAYFLPKQKLRITAVRTIKPLLPLSAVAEAHRKARAASEAADTDAGTKSATHAAEKANLAALQAQGAAPALIAAAEQRVLQADLNERIALAAKQAGNAEFKKADDYLRLRQDDPKLSAVVETKVELKILDPEPDPKTLYYATPRHGLTRDDTLKVVVGANGLLTSSNVVADDRTDEIIVEAAGAVSLFIRGVSSLGTGPSYAYLKSATSLQKCPRDKLEPLLFDVIVDPLHYDDQEKEFHIPDREDAHSNEKVNERLGICFGYRVTLVAPTFDKSTLAAHARASYPGYAYRARVPWTINLERYHGSEAVPNEADFVIEKSFIALLPNGGPVAYIPIKAAPFVRTVNDVTFKDGSIASWDNTRPSEMLEAVRLPVRVAKQIVSVPTELLQMKVDFSSKEKAMAEVQAAQIATETKLRLLQECLVKETGAGNDGAACVK